MIPVDPNRLIRVSPAEAIVDPFYENQFSCLDRYAFRISSPGGAPGPRPGTSWTCASTCGRGRAPRPASRACRIDASAFDAFRMRLSLSTNVRVAAFLTVDGVEQRVIDEPGRGEFRECGGASRPHGSKRSVSSSSRFAPAAR